MSFVEAWRSEIYEAGTDPTEISNTDDLESIDEGNRKTYSFELTMAMTTPLLISPPAFPPAQAKLTAILGKTPTAAITVPA